MRGGRLLAASALSSLAHAVYLSNELSFGHDGRISGNGRSVEHFHLQGQPNMPEILSNKVVLTPPAPGNQRGAIWSQDKLLHTAWGAEVDFRVSGPERASGNLQIWYVRNGEEDVGTSSIYTVGKFDGLALVVDQYAGSGGTIRGFLNDGSTDYRSHHNVDSLAFGHCSYSYRNLGRPSQLTIRQIANLFRVEIDNELCFESDKMKLPAGNNFGISAASAENPDSFEIFKFVVTTDSNKPSEEYSDAHQHDSHGGTQNQPPPAAVPAAAPASAYRDTTSQFADLHDRLAGVQQQLSALSAELTAMTQGTQNHHRDLLTRLSTLESRLGPLDRLADLTSQTARIAADVQSTKTDLHASLDRHVTSLKQGMQEGSEGLGEKMKASSGTSWWQIVMLVGGSQVVSVGGYALYKARRRGGAKKFL